MNSRFLKIAYTMTAALLLAACSQNEFSDGQGEPLPEGRYPLEISSVTMSAQSSSERWSANAPQTRVAENTTDGNSSHWTDGDQIGMQIGDNTETGVYTVNVDADGNVTLTPTTPLYWENTIPSQAVKAWYPATDGTLNLSDQSSSLAYVLAGTGSGDYKSPVSLSFAHALAKVRVKFEGAKANEVTGMHLYTYTSCTHTKGMVSGATEGWIKMKAATYNGVRYYEANIVPGYKIEKFKINDAIEGTLTTAVTSQAAKVHEITIDVKPAGPVVIQPTDGKFTINKDDDVIIKDHTGTEPIEVRGNATITIENVKLTTGGTVMTIKGNASVTLNVKGQNNEFTATNGSGISLDVDACINIKGDGSSSSKLVVKADGSSNVGIGSSGVYKIGSIQINNITLEVIGGSCDENGHGTAAIGLRHTNNYTNQSCDLISIVNSNVKATSNAGACIGLGSIGSHPFSQKITTINIEKSTIEGSALDGSYDKGGACVGSGGIINSYNNAKGEIGTIIIKETTFTNCSVGGSYIVGCGGRSSGGSANQFTVTNGIIVDGTNRGNKGWSPNL